METVSTLATAFLTLTLTLTVVPAMASDPDILTDFTVPPNVDPTKVSGQFFTFTNFRNILQSDLAGKSTAVITKASKKEFPALDGEGVSVAHLLFPPTGVNPPHFHPRASEVLIVLEGTLEIGLVDTTNKLYTQTLQPQDLFVFPKGMIHYQVNRGEGKAVALGLFGSSSAGTVSIGASLFRSGINPHVLAKAFKTDEKTISKIVAANK